MFAYTVILRNAAGREVTRIVPSASGNTAANRAARSEKRATGEAWYVVTCEIRGGHIHSPAEEQRRKKMFA